MSATMICPFCNRKLKIPEQRIGKKGKCPGCGQEITCAIDAAPARREEDVFLKDSDLIPAEDITIDLVLKILNFTTSYHTVIDSFKTTCSWNCKKVEDNIIVNIDYEISLIEDNKYSSICVAVSLIDVERTKGKALIYNHPVNHNAFEMLHDIINSPRCPYIKAVSVGASCVFNHLISCDCGLSPNHIIAGLTDYFSSYIGAILLKAQQS